MNKMTKKQLLELIGKKMTKKDLLKVLNVMKGGGPTRDTVNAQLLDFSKKLKDAANPKITSGRFLQLNNDNSYAHTISEILDELSRKLELLNDIGVKNLKIIIEEIKNKSDTNIEALEYIVEQWKAGNIIITGDDGDSTGDDGDSTGEKLIEKDATIKDLKIALTETTYPRINQKVHGGKRKSKVKISNR